MLSHIDISDALRNGVIGITPFNPDHLQPASYDVTLSGQFMAYYPWIGRTLHKTLDGSQSVEELGLMEAYTEEQYMLGPHDCVLATTAERITLGASHIARIEGRSSIGRMFLTTHVTAGFCDPDIHVRADHGFGGRQLHLGPDAFGRLLVDLNAKGIRFANPLGVTVRCHPGSMNPFSDEWIEVLG